MAKVTLRGRENFEQMLRRFKRAVDEEKIIPEVRGRQHFEKPSMKRKLEKSAAVKRHKRKIESERSERERKY